MGSAIGVILVILGIILLIGNLTGWWLSFPYAGFITMSLGGLIMKISDDD
jgi:hypothetical protein